MQYDIKQRFRNHADNDCFKIIHSQLLSTEFSNSAKTVATD